ncbi:MFS transporter [Saccharibacillus kuerlensis]|uniref:MFS transporter n=1 Tax=Saccharibacillus kuerlensis TaxID=459527 RepID=A0ABQ2L3Z8_9BACL|nr:MFS transporter [Saccharibacillus kuerlensis]GGO01677.1 MFS transporter [Saccharibacillus kuerlensis]
MNTATAKNNSGSFALIGVLAFAMVISVMNSTMFNVALPVLRQEFELSSSQVSWVVTAYIIVYAIGSVTYGKLADKFGLKNLITFGLICFAVGSLVGMFATGFGMIIAGRVFQSIGASVIPASSMLIPIRYVSTEQRGRALGITSAGMALGTAIGPIVAGFLLGFASWRFLFAISLLVLIALPFFRRYLKTEPSIPGKADLPGGVLLAATIALLLLSITGRSWGYAAATLAAFLLFVWRIRRANQPFVDPGIFRIGKYTMGLIIGCMVLTLNLCVPYLIPQLLSSVNGLNSLQTGMVMFPGAVVAALLGLVGGRIADAKGNIFLFAWAFALQLAGYIVLFSYIGMGSWPIALLLIVVNTGLTFAQITLANTVSRTLSGPQTGVGMGIYMMSSFIAGAVGTSVLGLVLDGRSGDGGTFGSIFGFFAIWIAAAAVLYFVTFGRKAATKVWA